jgi:hypothetical protein
MLFSEKILKLENGSQYVLRSPRREDAAAMLRYLQQTSAETHFLIRTPEEAESDVQSEEEFLAQAEKASRDVMIAAFSDGRVLGVSAISCVSDRSKMRHRASLAIALLREAWGQRACGRPAFGNDRAGPVAWIHTARARCFFRQ